MDRIRYAIPMVRQRTSPVCWLACAMMLLQRHRRANLGQNEINYINGDPRMASVGNVGSQPRITATLQRWGFRVRRLRQVHVPLVNFSEAGRNTHEPQSMLWNSNDKLVEVTIMYAMLRNFGPFILFHRCGTFSYGPSRTTPSSGYHAVLITGIDLESKVCYFNNPWGDVNVPTSIDSMVGAIKDWESRRNDPTVAYLVN